MSWVMVEPAMTDGDDSNDPALGYVPMGIELRMPDGAMGIVENA